MKRQKYELLDSKISGMLDFHSVTEKVSVRNFMEKSEGYAKLIFCTEPSDFPAEFVATKTNCRDIERIRRLKASDIFLISEPELARGLDYRCADGTKGISLLVMGESSSVRAYIQLLGRVGRYHDPCLRFLWDELDDRVCQFQEAVGLAKLRLVKGPVKQQQTQVKGQQRLQYMSAEVNKQTN